MAAREARLELRLDERSKEHIARAAQLSHESVSTFVLVAAERAADQVIARADHLIMPAEQFDALVASLDMHDEAPALRRLADRPRRYHRV
jgi:uncharacterized protein (DUF1778 family)